MARHRATLIQVTGTTMGLALFSVASSGRKTRECGFRPRLASARTPRHAVPASPACHLWSVAIMSQLGAILLGYTSRSSRVLNPASCAAASGRFRIVCLAIAASAIGF